MTIGFLRRLVRPGRSGGESPPEPAPGTVEETAHSAEASVEAIPAAHATDVPATAAGPQAPDSHPHGQASPAHDAAHPAAHLDQAFCPYCAVPLDQPPDRGRLCPRCRKPIVVRRVDGRKVLLTREAVEVFEAERKREAQERSFRAERARWLALARGVGAESPRLDRLEAALPSAEVVSAARDLCMTAADRAARSAAREKLWREVARIRRLQAVTVHEIAGSPVPPSDEAVELFRAWSEAALRSLTGFGAKVELVSTGCCATCAHDDGRAFRIAAELRVHRLPHAGCPKGLCQCDWWPLPDVRKRPRKTRRTGAGHAASSSAVPAASTPAGEVESSAAHDSAVPEPADEPGTGTGERGLPSGVDDELIG